MTTQNQRVSRKQEGRILKSFKEIQDNARTTIGSGNKWFNKSDVVTELFRVEAKTKASPSKSITVKKEWMDKIEKEAYETGKIALLAFSFGDSKDYIAIESSTFITLMQELIQLRGDLK